MCGIHSGACPARSGYGLGGATLESMAVISGRPLPDFALAPAHLTDQDAYMPPLNKGQDPL